MNLLRPFLITGFGSCDNYPATGGYMGHRKYHYTAAYLKVNDASDLPGLIAFTKSQLEAV